MDTATQVYDFFTQSGFTPEQACGIVANIQAESNFNPGARGDGGLAHGLCQWHPDRLAAMKAGTGIDMLNPPTVANQIKGLLWELNYTESGAGKKLKASATAFDAGYNMCRFFERPASQDQWAKRGHMAETWFEHFSKQGNLHVETPLPSIQ